MVINLAQLFFQGEELDSCRGSDFDVGEFCSGDDDALDCIDDSAVASLDEDYIPSECAGMLY